MQALTPQERRREEGRFLLALVFCVILVALIPTIYALLAAPPGGSYLGYEFNTDDHMVYSAWMRQAMDGHLLMDNRFTTEPQPGLTIHIYFFILGLLAKIVGLPASAALARVGFSALFLVLAYRLIRRADADVYRTKLALVLTVVGGGLGFLVWHSFGQLIVRPVPDVLKSVMLGRLPTDVWQPEGFVLPSMLTNGLFMVSLCLILFVFDRMLQARTSWKPVLPGALAFGVLMNIHSYDVLLTALVMVAFGAASIARKQATWLWVGRALCIGAGAILPALWFVYVLQHDPVFRERAATETFSPNFRQVLFGYLPVMAVAIAGLVYRAHTGVEGRSRRLGGAALATVVLLAMTVASTGHESGYFMSLPVWIVAFFASLVATVLLSEDDSTMNLFISWALIGTVAIYFPALFQRKLAMGLSVPWAILSAFGIAAMMRNQERSARNLATILVIVLFGASSLRWLIRECGVYIANNVASTARHRVYASGDLRRMVSYLDSQPGRRVVLALPGAPNPSVDGDGQQVPDSFESPVLPDLAPIISGLSGAYSYAGHWSETPDYARKAGIMSRFFFTEPWGGLRRVMTDDERRALIQETGATHAILPVPEAYPMMPIVPVSRIGHVVVSGTQFQLVELNR